MACGGGGRLVGGAWLAFGVLLSWVVVVMGSFEWRWNTIAVEERCARCRVQGFLRAYPMYRRNI